MNKQQKQRLKRIVILILSVLMLVYIVYQVVMATHDRVRTEVVPMVTMNDSVKTEIFAVRDEHYVTNNNSGTIISLVSDGNRVSNGGGVAAVFQSQQDASNYAQSNKVGAELKRYNRLNSQSGSYAVNVSNMNAQIADDVINLAEAVDNNDLEEAQDDIYTVRDMIITRQVATGQAVDLNSKVASLSQQYSSLMQKSSRYSSISANASGYYSSSPDGYERTVNYKKVKDLTVKQIQKIMKAEPEKISSKVIGKVSSDFDWYMICVVPSSYAGSLAAGDSVTVNLPYSGVSTVPAKVAAVNRDPNGNKSAVILVSNRMNSYISHLRKEKAELVIDSYTGLRVNVKGIAVNKKGEKGVYTKDGNIARFKKLDIIYSTKKYVISRPHETSNYVSLYDNVIIGGKNIYDGKIV